MQPRAQFGKPLEVGYFSQDEAGVTVVDSQKALCKYLSPPRQADLNLGFDSFVDTPVGHTVGMTDYAQWLQAQKLHPDQQVQQKFASYWEHKTDMVTYRGMLTKMMLTPYSKSDSWQCVAVRRGGKIYLLEVDTQEKIRQEETRDRRGEMMCFWGRKFEQYTSIPASDCENTVVNAYKAYASVCRTSINNIRLLIAGEVDSYLKGPEVKQKPRDHYIELKTHREIQGLARGKTKSYLRYKLLKSWAQAYLLNIAYVTVGFRNDQGILLRTQIYKTNEIPSLVGKWSAQYVPGGKPLWESAVCLKFLASTLSWIQSVCKAQETQGIKEDTLLFFRKHQHREQVTVTEIPPQAYAQYKWIPPQAKFFPDWYTL
jgi:RAT1-interacting protein